MRKAVEQLVQQVIALRKDIAETDVEEAVWFRNMLCGILNCALREHRSVEIGLAKSVTLAAWGTRNLLELDVITDFILKSEGNAVAFRNDLAIDAKDFYEAVSKGTQVIHEEYLETVGAFADQQEGRLKEILTEIAERDRKRGPQTSIADSEAETFREFMRELGLTINAKPKQTGQMAELLGPESKAAYAPMFKICSKLVHPTAFSIASTTIQGSLDEVIPLLDSSATCYLLSIFGNIGDYFKLHGATLPVPAEQA